MIWRSPPVPSFVSSLAIRHGPRLAFNLPHFVNTKHAIHAVGSRGAAFALNLVYCQRLLAVLTVPKRSCVQNIQLAASATVPGQDVA